MSSTFRTAIHAVLFATSAGIVLAQQPGSGNSVTPKAASSRAAAGAGSAPASAASSASANGTTGYRSAFEGYRAFNEQPVHPWRESNDVVGRIGGWQSYAREGQGGPVAGSTPATLPVSSAASANAPIVLPAQKPKAPGAPAAASAAMPSDHSGHRQP